MQEVVPLTYTFTDSEMPVPVVKMESQSHQLDPAQYLGYQPANRGDWATIMTPPTVQQPIDLQYRVPNHRRVQAAGA